MRKIIVYVGIAASFAIPTTAWAQAGPSSSASATASAQIVQPIRILCGAMQFGRLAPLPTAPAVVVLPAQGTPLVDTSNIVVPGTRDFATPSNCTVRGEYLLSFNVTLPTTTTLLSGGNMMTLDTFTISNEVDGMPLNRLLDTLDGSLGLNGFGVGATLHVGAAQPPGMYTGPFQVSVQYN